MSVKETSNVIFSQSSTAAICAYEQPEPSQRISLFSEETTIGAQRLRALEELLVVFEETSSPNWDGFDSRPVEPRTLAWAAELLMSLPAYIPEPGISVHPDGQISFEWFRDPHHVFALSIDGRGVIHYSGILGPKDTRGTDQFADRVPVEIDRQIQRHLHGDG